MPVMNEHRRFLIVFDNTHECETAAMFAAMRAHAVGAGLVILRTAQTAGFAHWRGLDEEMQAEARDAALFEARALAERIQAKTGIDPEIVIRDGQAVAAIADVVDDDPAIKVLVLASGSEKNRGPGPLVTRMAKGKPLANRPLAVTVVPGRLTENELNEMGGFDS